MGLFRLAVSHRIFKFFPVYFSFLLVILSCKDDHIKRSSSAKEVSFNSSIKYAKGFDIQDYGNFKKLIIKSPYPEAENYQEFILISLTDTNSTTERSKNKLVVPLKEIIATSTTHIPMIELLGEETSLIGFPNSKYISSPKTRTLIENGLIKEIGNEQDFNTEILISLQPEAVVGFSMGKTNRSYDLIEKNGIPVIFNGEWLEETPLGRAEWIKFFGALFDKDSLANSIFNKIETRYNEVKEMVHHSDTIPTILTNVLYKDKWSLPAGESFTAQLFKDANTNYLWEGTSGQGSVVLSFETVYDRAKDADYWIGSGYFTSLQELGEANPHYKEFKPFKNSKVYTFSKKRGDSGGVLYFEFAPIQPHIVLQDIIKVTHPEILPNHELHFLEKLE